MSGRGWAPSGRSTSANDSGGTGPSTPLPTPPPCPEPSLCVQRTRVSTLHAWVLMRVEQGVIHRECGVLKTTYEADMGLYPLPIARWTVAAVAVLFFLVIPLTLHEYFLSVANLVWIAIIGALGLNILVGYTGQVSIGHGAFMSVGAYTAANLANGLGSPWAVTLLVGGVMAAPIGVIGVTGVLYTYFLGIANYEQFQIGVSIDYLAMIIIGGLGSVLGSIFGAIFVTLLPIVIRYSMEAFGGIFFSQQTVLNLIPNLRLMMFGALIIFFLIVEPEGLNRLWRNIRSYFRVWPFAY